MLDNYVVRMKDPEEDYESFKSFKNVTIDEVLEFVNQMEDDYMICEIYVKVK